MSIHEVPSAYWDLVDEIIVDREADRYLWMIRGYQKHKRIHACVVRIDIINGKLWIQQDRTEGIAPELERYGVPKNTSSWDSVPRICDSTQNMRLSS